MPTAAHPTADIVRQALLAAFAEIAKKSGHAPTHLDMDMRLEDATRFRAQYRPVSEGGRGLLVTAADDGGA